MDPSELIDDYIAKLTDWRGALIASIRGIVKEADPEIIEEWKWRGCPVWSHDGIICLAVAFKDKVKLTFYDGASLQDPDKFFNTELEGNKWRATDFYQGDIINATSFANLVRAAIVLNQSKVKPAAKARGSKQ
jgi:hypothetical protein